jgi:4-amino-4-deoxy-L-arabinose transferase-like glycosyltransferase
MPAIPSYQPRYKLPAFVLILLLAAAGRITHIDLESLWVDEGFSYWAIRHPDMFGLILRDVHPPLYFVLLRGWAEVAGITELALRYLSVLPGLLSVAAVYHVARELERARGGTAETVVPLLAALLLALADMEIYIAQQVRMYTWHVLWAVLSMWAFTRWTRTGGRGSLAAWVATSLLLLYTHYIGVCLVIAQGLYVLLFLSGGLRRVAVGALALIGLLFVPWLLVVVSGQTANIGTGFARPSTLATLYNWRINWFTGQWALLLGLAMLGLVTLVYGERVRVHWRPLGPAFLLLAWFIVPIALTYLLNFHVPILMDYRLTQITPAVALLIAFGLGNLRGVARTFLVVVIVVYGLTSYDTPAPRPPWREVGLNAARYAVPGDLALAHVTPSGDWQVLYYYERFMPPGVERRSLRQWQLEDGATYADGLPALLAEHATVWFMHWSSDRSGFAALERTGHRQTAVMSEDWLGNDLNVYRFDQVPPESERIAAFAPGLILRAAAIYPDELRVDLWWSANTPLDDDYTISARLLDESGRLVAQLDSAPFAGQRPTATWAAGEVVYDPRRLELAEGIDALPPGTYTVAVQVYRWTPEGIIDITTTEGDRVAVIGTLAR